MVKISYTRIKNTFFRESEREEKTKSSISRILLFHSEIGQREYKHYNKHCKHS